MLQFLQTGRMLYVLGAICLLGIISKLVTSSLYKRLIKETGNMALTNNKNLKALKQKTENLFLVSHGIRNPDSYIEKQLYGFQFLRLSLDHWDNLSLQAMILCFLTGGAAAFGAYWYRCDSYYIVLYGAMGGQCTQSGQLGQRQVRDRFLQKDGEIQPSVSGRMKASIAASL